MVAFVIGQVDGGAEASACRTDSSAFFSLGKKSIPFLATICWSTQTVNSPLSPGCSSTVSLSRSWIKAAKLAARGRNPQDSQ